MTDLKPCPFCGTSEVSVKYLAGEFFPECKNGHSTGLVSSSQQAIVEAWNSRATPPEVAELVEALRPFADALKDNYRSQPDSLAISMGNGSYDLRWVLPLGDFRRARATLDKFNHLLTM